MPVKTTSPRGGMADAPGLNPGALRRAGSTPAGGTDRPTITVMEAAALLGIGRSMAYKLAATGELVPGVPVLRMRRRLVVMKQALRDVLEGTATPQPPAVPGNEPLALLFDELGDALHNYAKRLRDRS